MVADVANQQSPAVGRHRDRVRLTQGGRGRRPAVSGEARLSGARQSRDLAWCARPLCEPRGCRARRYTGARPVEHRFMRHAQRRVDGRAAVAGVALLAVAGEDGRPPRSQVEPADTLVVEVAEDERAVRSEDDAVRVVHLLIGKARAARADHGGDGGRGPGRRPRDQQCSQSLEGATAVHRRHDTSSPRPPARSTMRVGPGRRGRRSWPRAVSDAAPLPVTTLATMCAPPNKTRVDARVDQKHQDR